MSWESWSAKLFSQHIQRVKEQQLCASKSLHTAHKEAAHRSQRGCNWRARLYRRAGRTLERNPIMKQPFQGWQSSCHLQRLGPRTFTSWARPQHQVRITAKLRSCSMGWPGPTCRGPASLKQYRSRIPAQNACNQRDTGAVWNIYSCGNLGNKM